MTIDALFEQLKHPNPHLRERAMLELSEVRDANTIPRLIGLLGEENVTYRRAAVKSLGFIGTDSVKPLVELLLNSDNVTVKASCAKALAQVSFNHPKTTFPSEGIEGLKAALEDPNPVVYTASVMALGQVGLPALDILIQAAKGKDNVAVAVASVNALGSIGDEKAQEVLLALANDESADPYVQELAKSASSRWDMVSKYREVNEQRARGDATT